jgi:nucleotide-binding universal stress UspA family protein
MEVRRLKQLDHHRHPQASIFTSTGARDLDAGMVVMGAYGHSRLREYVLGGATRTALSTMSVPLLMSH